MPEVPPGLRGGLHISKAAQYQQDDQEMSELVCQTPLPGGDLQ